MTAIVKKTGPAPFDLNAARAAAQREAAAEPFRFTFGANEFSIPPMTDWPLEVEVKLSEGALTAAMSGLLGDQIDLFMVNSPTFGDLRLLFEQVGVWAGVEGLGNLPAPRRPGSTQT